MSKSTPIADSPPYTYLFAGDFNVQSMRYEEKSPFPVQRHGFSFDVHRNKSISGCFVLRHLVELCFEYTKLPKNECEEEKKGSENQAKNESLKDKLDGARDDLRKLLGTKVLHIQPNPTPSKLTHYHESVAILRKSGLRDESSNPAADSLRAPRLHDSHSISASCSPAEDVTLKQEAFGNYEGDIPEHWNGDMVLNLDMKRFGMEERPGLEGSDFEQLPTPRGTSNLITRMVVPRAAINDPKQKANVESFIAGHSNLLEKYHDSRRSNTGDKGCSVLVISSESLRNTGLDISYRFTWERSISGIIRCLMSQGDCAAIPEESWDLGRQVRHVILQYDFIVICSYNDGAMIVPTQPGHDGDGDAVLIADPSQIEGDHSRRFEDTMRGTETLVTAAIAFHLRQTAEMEGRPEPTLFLPPCRTLHRIRRGTIHGVKASRYLQSHGYVTLHPCAYLMLKGGDDKVGTDGKGKAYQEMRKKLDSSSADIVRYLWNRTRSTAYALEGLVVGAEEVLKRAETKDTKFCVWPLGDLAEILASGHPTYGSFPPVGLRLEEGREAIEKETRRVNDAWNDSRWLEVGRFRWSDVIRRGEENRGGYPYWSLREVAVKRLAKALQFAKTNSTGGFEKLSRTVALALLCEMIIRFGAKNLNRIGMSPAKQFDYELVKRVLQFHSGDLKTPDFYANFFRNEVVNGHKSVFDPVAFLSSLAGCAAVGELGVDVTRSALGLLNEAFCEKSCLAEPSSGSLLGIFPEFSVQRFHTFDGRDTQSFRDIRERLLNFQASDEKKPLNLLVLGSPGSGKSFGVTNIVEGVFGSKKVQFLEYNVASFSGNKASLESAFLEIQNVALQGKMPVVFWDEFDTAVDGKKLSWLASFLGPMQDGKFLIEQTSRHLPKCVFVFAGSVFSRFEQIRLLDSIMSGRGAASSQYITPNGLKPIGRKKHERILNDSKKSDEDQTVKTREHIDLGDEVLLKSLLQIEKDETTFHFLASGPTRIHPVEASVPCSPSEWGKAKGRDFKSRITGVLDISTVDPRTDDEEAFSLEEDKDAWLFRRAAAVRQSFETHAGHLLNSEKELQISESTLFSFLTVPAFDHGYRSIENMVRMSSLNQRAIADGSVVPTEAQVRIHSQTDLFGNSRTIADGRLNDLF